VTEPFCRDCHRARLSADGKLYTCLFAALGWDVLGCLRAGANDVELANYLSYRANGKRFAIAMATIGALGQRSDGSRMAVLGQSGLLQADRVGQVTPRSRA